MPSYNVFRGDLASFGSENDHKYVRKGTVTLQGNSGAWVTIPSDEYWVRRRTGRIEQRLVKDSGVPTDWDAYDPELGGGGWRVTYTVFDNGTETIYTNETLALVETQPYALDFDSEVQANPVVEFIDAEAGRIAQWLIGVVDAYTISADNGKVKINSQVPSIAMGESVASAASGFSSGKGIWQGKYAASDWRWRVGDPTSPQPLLSFDNTDLTLRSAGIEVFDGATQTGNIQKTGAGWFGASSSAKTLQWWTTGAAAGDVKLGGDDDYALWDDDGGGVDSRGKLFIQGNVEITGELHTAVFVKNLIRAEGGSVIIAKNASTLTANVTTAAGANTLNLKDQDGAAIAAVNDILRLKSAAGDNWFTVTAVGALTDGSRNYTCTRNSGGNASFKKGAAVVNYGVSGQGFLYLTADDANAPFYSVRTHAGSPWSATTERGRFGNMNGAFGVAANVYGFGIGDYTGGNYLRYEQNGGLVFKSANGALTSDATGIGIEVVGWAGDVRAYKFTDSGTVMGGVFGDATGTYLSLNLDVRRVTGKESYLSLSSDSAASQRSELTLSNYQNGVFKSKFELSTDAAGTKVARLHDVGLTWNTDNAYDIGASGANRPRTIYAGTSIEIGGTAPQFVLRDATASAKSLRVTVDANLAKFEEVGGAANNLCVLDLANARMGVGTASPTSIAHAKYSNTSGYNVGVTTLTGEQTTHQTSTLDFNSFAVTATLNLSSASGITNNYSQSGMYVETSLRSAHAGTLGWIRSLFVNSNVAASAAGTISQLSSVIVQLNNGGANTATVTTWHGVYIGGASKGSGQTLTNAYGLIIQDQTAASSLNYAIYTGRGDVRLMSNTADKLGFWGATPVARPAAYTQTYSTPDKTLAAQTASALSGITTSSTGSVLIEPAASYTQSNHQQNYRRLQDQFNNLRNDHLDLAQVVNSLIDDFQALGLIG